MEEFTGFGALPIDRKSSIDGKTYRELVEELDEADLGGSEFAIDFVADAMDKPERFRTPKQLSLIEKLYRQFILGEDDRD